MTTAYTGPVERGEITDFKAFALHCARAFFVWSRDNDDPLPEAFAVPGFYDEDLAKAQKRLAEFQGLRDSLKAELYKADMAEIQDEYLSELREAQDARDRLSAMLAEAIAWNADGELPVKLRAFMVEQLSDAPQYISLPSAPRIPATIEEWYESELKERAEKVKTCIARRDEEVNRARICNEKLRLLREALGIVDKAA